MAVTRQQRRSGARRHKRRQAPLVNDSEALARKAYQDKRRYKSPDIQDTITVQAIYAHEEQSISTGEEQENQSHLNQLEARQHQNTQLLEIQQHNTWLLDPLEHENQKTSRLEAELEKERLQNVDVRNMSVQLEAKRAEERLQNDEGRQLVADLEAEIHQLQFEREVREAEHQPQNSKPPALEPVWILPSTYWDRYVERAMEIMLRF